MITVLIIIVLLVLVLVAAVELTWTREAIGAERALALAEQDEALELFIKTLKAEDDDDPRMR